MSKGGVKAEVGAEPAAAERATATISVDPSTPQPARQPGRDSKNARPGGRRWRFWRKEPPTPQLSKDELRSALALHSPGLVAELHAISLRALQAEEQRETRLDTKAQSLLTTATLTMTVAFGFGGAVLLAHPEYLRAGGQAVAVTCLAAYGIALFLGLLASFCAVSALRVSDGYRHVSEADAFNTVELRDADAACTNPDTKSDNEKAVALYQRYMTSAYWRIWQQHYRVHERKASRIRRGQNFLVGFLGMLLLIAGTLAYTAREVYVASGKAPVSNQKANP